MESAISWMRNRDLQEEDGDDGVVVNNPFQCRPDATEVEGPFVVAS